MRNVFLFYILIILLEISGKNDWEIVKMYEKKTNLKNFSLNYWSSKMIMFGGCYINENCSNKIFIFDFTNKILEEFETKGNKPSPRSGHSAIIYGNELIIYGGSNRFGVLGDLYVLDLILFEWRKVEYSGYTPEPRSFHTSNLDKNLRMVVFGGFKLNKLTNDVIIYDLRKNEWIKPIVSGKWALKRQNHSSTILNNILYIFGGYTNGTFLNDLSAFNIDDSKWLDVQITGVKPKSRQNALFQGIEKTLFISGGCNYSKNKCYNDIWEFDLVKMKYKELITKSKFDINIGNSIIKGPSIYYMGGCFMNSNCDSKILKFNTTHICPNNCSKNGLCSDSGECNCNKLNFGNDCSYKFDCLEDCGNNAYCDKNSKCKCYSGYTGENCKIVIPCKNNCTSSLHGICMSTGYCNCHNNWDSEDCSVKINITESKYRHKTVKNDDKNLANLNLELFGYTQFKIKMEEDYKNFYEKYEKLNKCKNNCNYRGFCSNENCYCKNGYFGVSCSLTKQISNKETYKYLLIYIGIGLAIGILGGGIFSFFLNKIKKPEI